MLPSQITVFSDEKIVSDSKLYTLSGTEENDTVIVGRSSSGYSSGKYTAKFKILGLLPIKTVTIDVITKQQISLGGQTFGVRLYTQGVMVVGCGDFLSEGKSINPAYKAGIRIGDRLISADGVQLTSNEQLQELVAGRSSPIVFEVVRKNLTFTASVTPIIPDGEHKYRLGLWVRDSTAGLGTVTYYNHTTDTVGGLGHSIADIDTGDLMPSAEGSLAKAKITEIIPGEKGTAGQLAGSFLNEDLGKLIANTDQGIFAECTLEEFERLPTVEIALKNEVEIGAAQIYTQLDNKQPRYYDIEIEKIHNNLEENKNMVIRVTDPELLERTGGIVQGMSGSPIVQNGKLIGAVTHVFLDDPTCGYAIFIEKMLITENELTQE